MEKHLKKIYNLNIISIVLLVIYVAYLLHNVIFALYKERDIKIMAGVLIPAISLIIINVFISSIRSISKGLYERFKQKVAAIFFIMFVAASDILIIYAFMSFHPLGKILFLMINFVAFLHARRYMFKNALNSN